MVHEHANYSGAGQLFHRCCMIENQQIQHRHSIGRKKSLRTFFQLRMLCKLFPVYPRKIGWKYIGITVLYRWCCTKRRAIKYIAFYPSKTENWVMWGHSMVVKSVQIEVITIGANQWYQQSRTSKWPNLSRERERERDLERYSPGPWGIVSCMLASEWTLRVYSTEHGRHERGRRWCTMYV